MDSAWHCKITAQEDEQVFHTVLRRAHDLACQNESQGVRGLAPTYN